MNKIVVFTGTRAEYGLLYFLLKELAFAEKSGDIILQLWAGGSHLSQQYGYTIEHILADGFNVTEQLDFLQTSHSATGTAKSLAKATELAAIAFEKQQPDLLVLLGDRYEALALAQTAMLFQVPIAHIHGGEITTGAVDDVIRHAISKMSHIHFVAAEPYRQRLIQMGEQPSQVFNVGAPGLDYLHETTFLTRAELSSFFGFDFTKPYFLITYHPETLDKQDPVEQLTALLLALAYFPQHQLVITYPNSDTFSEALIQCLKEFQTQHSRVLLLTSMGQVRYLSAMKNADLVIGNSSSGIIEAPSFNVPTVNIGDRQKGRLASESVLHCAGNTEEIIDTIKQGLLIKKTAEPSFYRNPYGQGQASKQIAKHLVSYTVPAKLHKTFFDMDVQ